MNSWGKELILDCFNCDPDKIRSADNIYNFAKTLVSTIDMVAYGEPNIVMFGTGDKAGYTLIQLIETSNICAHFSEDTNSMYLNVFSCKDFQEYYVIKLVREFFGSSEAIVESVTVPRGRIPFPVS